MQRDDNNLFDNSKQIMVKAYGRKPFQAMRKKQFGTLAISPGLMLKNFSAAQLILRLEGCLDVDFVVL